MDDLTKTADEEHIEEQTKLTRADDDDNYDDSDSDETGITTSDNDDDDNNNDYDYDYDYNYDYDEEEDKGEQINLTSADEDSDSDDSSDCDETDSSSDDDDDDYGYDYAYDGFSQNFRVYPLSMVNKTHLEGGNKIILPLSALQLLMDFGLDSTYPMLFKLTNPASDDKTSHCGVLEFTAEEGVALMPDWMINNMSLEEGGTVNIKSVNLETATYIKLQPHSVDFLALQSPKDVLEASFCLGYSCLSVGDTILIMFEDKRFYVDVVDAKPSNAVCIIETDCEVDFAPPLDYKEPKKEAVKLEEEREIAKFVPFTGRSRRLNGEASDLQVGGEMNKAVNAGSRTGKRCNEMNKIVFGGTTAMSSSSTKEDSTTAQVHSDNRQIFEPFSGKKYRLID